MRGLCVILLLGCSVTETGNPPVRPEAPMLPADVSPFAAEPDQVSVTFTAPAGALDPALRLRFATSGGRFIEGTVAADGSLSQSLSLRTDEGLRYWQETSERASLPVDHVLSADFTDLVPRVLSLPCFALPEDVDLRYGDTLFALNGCDEAVEVRGPIEGPTTVPAGERAEFRIRGRSESLVQIALTGPANDTRWLTILDP